MAEAIPIGLVIFALGSLVWAYLTSNERKQNK